MTNIYPFDWENRVQQPTSPERSNSQHSLGQNCQPLSLASSASQTGSSKEATLPTPSHEILCVVTAGEASPSQPVSSPVIGGSHSPQGLKDNHGYGDSTLHLDALTGVDPSNASSMVPREEAGVSDALLYPYALISPSENIMTTVSPQAVLPRLRSPHTATSSNRSSSSPSQPPQNPNRGRINTPQQPDAAPATLNTNRVEPPSPAGTSISKRPEAAIPDPERPPDVIRDMAAQAEVPDISPQPEVPDRLPQPEVPEIAPQPGVPDIASQPEVPTVAPQPEVFPDLDIQPIVTLDLEQQSQAIPNQERKHRSTATVEQPDTSRRKAKAHFVKAVSRTPVDRVYVAIPISRAKRDKLIAHGVYDPFRDDVVKPSKRVRKTYGVRPANLVSIPNGNSGFRAASLREREDRPNRFVKAPGPAVLGPVGLVLTEESLENRVGPYECGWKGCGSILASEKLLAKHVRMRAHAVEGKLKAGQQHNLTIYQCHWHGCGDMYFDDIFKLVQHMEAAHIHARLMCPYNHCDLRSHTISHLLRHVRRHHEDETPRPLANAPFPPAMPKLPPLPSVAHTPELITQPVQPRWPTVLARQEWVQQKVQKGSMAGPDPSIRVEHPPLMLSQIGLDLDTSVANTREGSVEPRAAPDVSLPSKPKPKPKPKRTSPPKPKRRSKRIGAIAQVKQDRVPTRSRVEGQAVPRVIVKQEIEIGAPRRVALSCVGIPKLPPEVLAQYRVLSFPAADPIPE